MHYYLYLDDEQKGPYTVAQLQSMWHAGNINLNTLYWQEGATDWSPLSSIIQVLEPPATPTRPVVPKPAIKQSSVQAPASKPAQSPIVTFGCLFIIGVGGLAAYLSSTDNTNTSSRYASTLPANSSSAPVSSNDVVGFDGGADSLYREYDANEIAADDRYKGKLAIIRGNVKDIGKDILGDTYIVMGGSGFLDGVQCTFARGDSSAASLYKGKQVLVQGMVRGKMGHVQLDDCSLH